MNNKHKSRLNLHYYNNVIPKLKKILNIKNSMAVPRIIKITLNMGIGNANNNKQLIKNASNDLMLITGQKPVLTKSKKSISNFKIRKGWPIGLKVTLRGNKMYEFFDRLISITIPRIQDFRGFSLKSFDGRGNYNIGIKEQISFYEIKYNSIDKIRGMNISITTNSNNDKLSILLLKEFNFPLFLKKGI